MAFYLGEQKIDGVLSEYSTTTFDTSDANAIASVINKDYTAYVNGKKVVGTQKFSKAYIAVTPNAPDAAVGADGDIYASIAGAMWIKRAGMWASVTQDNESIISAGVKYESRCVWEKGVGNKDPNTILLLHGEDLTDSSQLNTQILNSGVTVSAAKSKFGDKSLYFNGSGAYLTIQNKNVIEGSNDFTIDWWEYRMGTNDYGTLFHHIFTASNNDYGVIIAISMSNGIKFYATTNVGTWNVASGTSMGSLLTNQWVHRAVVRSGSKIYIFQNGVLQASANVSGAFSAFGEYPTIGKYQNSAASISNPFYKGYVDEFRISNTARWTAAFTPPTEAYSSYKFVEYVESNDPNAYPTDGNGDDGYYYTRL